MTCGLVHSSYSLPEWQAVKLTFLHPGEPLTLKVNSGIIVLCSNDNTKLPAEKGPLIVSQNTPLLQNKTKTKYDPGVDAICVLSLLLVLSFAARGFLPGTPVFPSPQKPTFPNSNSTRNQVDEEPLGG